MKYSFRRALMIVLLMTSVSVILASIILLTTASTFSQAGLFVLMNFFCSVTGNAIAMMITHTENKHLADETNCPVEDIYYAREEIGWDKTWIKENIPSFYSLLQAEKRRRI